MSQLPLAEEEPDDGIGGHSFDAPLEIRDIARKLEDVNDAIEDVLAGRVAARVAFEL